jgi:hypothetical protein
MSYSHIPKIIWQTHEWEYKNLSYDYKMATLTWQNLNPDWQYRYVSSKEREKHIKEYDPKLFDYYQRCSGITQADIWKQVILYLYGGAYSDLDSFCNMPLNHMISFFKIQKTFICVPLMPNNMCITGSFAACPKNDISKKIINNVFIEKINMFNLENNIFIGWENISNEIIKWKDFIDFSFFGVFHGEHMNGNFKYNPNFEVHLENDTIKYSDLAKHNSWIF